MHVIRHTVLVEGRAIRAFARETGVSRITVRKYLGESEPKRKVSGPRSRHVEEKVKPATEALVGHDFFQSFARLGEGRDKGGVEARGQGVRVLAPAPGVADGVDEMEGKPQRRSRDGRAGASAR